MAARESLTKQETEGQYMTPAWVVELMLDEAGFEGPAALSTKVMEPCFGNGAFLAEILARMFDEGLNEGLDADEVVDIILENVCGVEKDPELFASAIIRLNAVLMEYGAKPVDWSGVLFNEDIYMVFGSAKNMFDLVIGSPPYIRIRHMGPDWYEIIRKFHAFDIGNAYTAFYVFGLYMLNKTGRLVYISPNGFMRDTTDRDLRDFILRKGLLKSICDFRSSKIFPDVSACFCICSLDRDIHREGPLTVRYSEYDMEKEVFSSDIDIYDMLRRFPDGSPWNLGV